MQYLTIKQAAERLSVSQDTIRRRLDEFGAVDLNHGKGKRMIRIPEDSLENPGCRIARPTIIKVHQTKFFVERRRA